MNLDGKAAILAAAQKAERQPTGNYWSSARIEGQAYVMRPKTGTYAIAGAHTETFYWSGAKAGMSEASFERELPARPLTARDTALWRKAGAPSSFRVWSGDHYATYTTKATKWEARRPDAGGGGDFLDGKSAEELRRLPSDPAELAEMFLSPKELAKAAGLPPGKELRQVDPAAKIARVATILEGAPIPRRRGPG
ncbi:hypothetical protein ACFQHO_18915 [Actinomadura yumaensis]|uniref:hypothetical protein n=1 Tax=Actinomadura TaxID=1988 RepID=UPI0013229AC0|nr:hypothetical protein [Actinomadura sp. J1-007]MWK35700.1 hypothetical protein [Actinomadura sp. J1-007]